MTARLRRLRNTPAIRRMLTETTLTAADFIMPLFVLAGEDTVEPIDAMPGQYRYTVDRLPEILIKISDAKIPAVLIFGLAAQKDETGSEAASGNGATQRAVIFIKENFPDICVITDLCLCPYTSHGHCGVVREEKIINDDTLPLLADIALSHARAGADFVAPSDMMDFRVRKIRHALDNNNLSDTGIISYSTKFASAFYGPFREAAASAPAFGDRRTYQMNPANAREAIRESQIDEQEGADMLMVKPALAFLDIIKSLRETTNLPLVCYNVSGEYSMVKAAAANGWINEKAVVLETLTSMKRAGSDLIITYHALDAARWLTE